MVTLAKLPNSPCQRTTSPPSMLHSCAGQSKSALPGSVLDHDIGLCFPARPGCRRDCGLYGDRRKRVCRSVGAGPDPVLLHVDDGFHGPPSGRPIPEGGTRYPGQELAGAPPGINPAGAIGAQCHQRPVVMYRAIRQPRPPEELWAWPEPARGGLGRGIPELSSLALDLTTNLDASVRPHIYIRSGNSAAA